MRKPKKYSEEEIERGILFSGNLRFMVQNGPINAAEVARRTGLSSALISKYVHGRSHPSEERIEMIAEALECTVDDLFDDTYAPWKFGEPVDEE